MSAERTTDGKYFKRFESEVLPKIDWREMFARQVVIAPGLVLTALQEAEHFLTTEPGPNLERRQKLAPKWFGYWQKLLSAKTNGQNAELIPCGDKLVDFDKLPVLVGEKYRGVNTGMIFVAGAEGHKGHVFAAKYMAGVVPVTFWGFEQDDYMQRKGREAPFLSLPLRLSMWFHENSISHLTVLPSNSSGLADNDHYNRLFLGSGVDYFFVHESDPYLQEKLARGRQDLDGRTISHPFQTLSTSEMVERIVPETSLEELRRILVRSNLRIIPNLPTASTSNRVESLIPNSKNLTTSRTDEIFQRVLLGGMVSDGNTLEESLSYADTVFVR